MRVSALGFGIGFGGSLHYNRRTIYPKTLSLMMKAPMLILDSTCRSRNPRYFGCLAAGILVPGPQ